MSGITNEYRFSRLTDEDLENDLDKLDLNIDKKNLVVAELSRRRTKELQVEIKKLSESIERGIDSSERFSWTSSVLSVAMFILAFVQVVLVSFSEFGEEMGGYAPLVIIFSTGVVFAAAFFFIKPVSNNESK